MSTSNANPLGSFLRDRRAKLDPASLGLSLSRRRTPGLRREEFAQRANISATWYTWLEQGRGGAPSADVLDRIARALLLTDSEREHLFVLGLGRPPGLRHRSDGGVTPRLQRVLDAMALSPAIVKTPTWDVVAWNRAAAAVLTDYGTLAPDQRNILRLIFCDPRVRAQQFDWEQVARFVVAAFRADAARAGQSPRFELLIEELSRASSDFKAMWESGEVVNFGEGAKRLRHPELGQIAFEYSTFAVDGRPDLSMVVYNPATTDDAARVQSLIEAQGKSVPIL